MAAVEVARRGVVLHQQRSAVAHVIQQSLVILRDVFARVVRANAQHDRSEAAEIAMCHIVRGQHSDVEPQLPQARWECRRPRP